MKRRLVSFILAALVAVSDLAAGPGPQVVYSEQKVSVSADSIALGRLLRFWDEATGMHSSIPRELASQIVSVNFSGLPLNEAVRRIFEKLPFDYVFIEAQGIIVTGRAQTPAVVSAPVYEGAPEVTEQLPELPEKKPGKPAPVVPPPPPVPTPFGPIPNPGQNAFIQLPPVLGATPPPFFAPAQPAQPPPVLPVNSQNDLFRPLSIYQDPSVPLPGPLQK
jgi:hypothetical protein